jgi:PBP1b-binding outer membrane lipoprotein LpoB
MTKTSSFIIVLFCITALWGCSVAPTESTVAGAITAYFKSSQYEVVDLKIGKIEDMPLSGKTYMGTPGYIVEVISITLEPQADKATDIRKGRQLTFSNARIRVRQDTVNKDVWHVSIISGISVI